MKAFSRFFMIMAAMTLMAACGDDSIDPVGGLGVKMDGLLLTFDKSVVQVSGDNQVTFTAFYNGNDVSSETVFYKVSDGKSERIERTHKLDQTGTYTFWAAYKTVKTENVTVSAIDREIPAAEQDPQSGSTSFVHRSFFNQHTGSSCVWCPFMTHLLHKTMKDGYEDKVVLASIRSGESGFPTVNNPSGSLPYLHIDYSTDYDHNLATDVAVERLRAKIDGIVSAPAKAGISASAKYYDDGQIIVRVRVKAAVKDEYNVGLWLLQDNFYSFQAFQYDSDPSQLDGTWVPGGQNRKDNPYDNHNNCVRVTDSRYLGAQVGYPLGTIEAGETAEWIFMVKAQIGNEDVNNDGETDVNDSWWKTKGKVNLADLHFAAFVTTHEGSVYTVVNAVDFPYNGSVAFEYR